MGDKNIAGERIREARLAGAQKVTLEDLSARLETLDVPLSYSSLAKIERGERIITDVQLDAIAKALKVKVAWLMNEE